ncbi:MAG: hypothetical protein N4A37_04065 [Prolixibacteraceae bacterium]|jgi:hypothetical protein|nr:hypothetical protein [Prolixibacteraceae bacterium]
MKDKLEYLENERILLWKEIEILKVELSKSSDDYLKDSRQDSRKTSEFRNKSEKAKITAEDYLNQIVYYKNQIEGFVNDFKNNLVESNNRLISVNELIQSSDKELLYFKGRVENVSNILDTIERYFEEHPDLHEEIKLFEKKNVDLDTIYSKSQVIQNSIFKIKKEVEDVRYGLFGFVEEDENGNEIEHKGTVLELENAYDSLKESESQLNNKIKSSITKCNNDFEEFKEEKNNDFKNVLKRWNDDATQAKSKIDKLLPDALTAGLSHAYSEKKKEEEVKETKLQKQFRNGIWMMICVSLIPFGVSIHSLLNDVSLIGVIERLPRLTLAILPLYIPVMWITYSANRKLNLTKRLIEEYSHKESLSKTFEGLSKQISQLEDDLMSRELRNKLLYNLLEVSSENPGKLMSDYNKADHPVMDVLEKSVKLANAVDKINRIPGFSKISELLQKRSLNLLIDEEDKVDKGISAITEESTKAE